MPLFTHVPNPLKPLTDCVQERKPDGFTVAEFIQERGIDPEGFVVLVDSRKTPPEEWDRPLHGDCLVIVTPEIGWAGVIALVVAIVVSVALYYFMPPPPTPAATPEASTAWTLRGQQNQMKLGEAIERHYGRMRVFPSYMARPFNRFKSDDQYMFALFCIGLGRYTVHNIKIDDTPIADFDEVEYEIYQPGERVKLFPTNVQTSSEVSGIELFGPNEEDYPAGGWSGPFVAASAGSQAYRLEVDISLREGLFYVTKKGGTGEETIEALFEYRLIDDDGDPLGSWTTLAAFERTLATTDPKRFTLHKEVDPGRYEVRAKRTIDTPEDYRHKTGLTWEGLRAICETEQDFGDVTLLAVKARATNNLNDSAQHLFNVEVTAEVPVYDVGSDDWTRTATRNPVWAFLDILRASYGKNLTRAFFDLPGLAALADELDADGVKFDGSFDSKTTIWEALQVVLNVADAVPVVNGGIVSAVRDTPQVIPTLGFNAHNIVKGTMTVQTVLENHGDFDGLEVEYLDPDSYKRKTVICLLDTDRGTNLKQVKLVGCRDRDKAYQWGLRQRAISLYQRENYAFETGIEGGTARFGDLIAVRHENIPSETDFLDAETGRLGPNALTVESGVTVIALPFTPDMSGPEVRRIALRDNLGVVRGPYICEAHPTVANKLRLEVEIDNADFAVDSGAEAPLFWFGISGTEYNLAKIVRIETAGDGERVKITAVPYDDRIYAFTGLEAPPLSAQYEPANLPAHPAITGLTVRKVPKSENEYQAAWKPALGATSYLLSTSRDGTKYTRLDTTEQAGYILTEESGAFWLKVQAVGRGGVGAASIWSGTLSDYDEIPKQVEDVELVEEVDDSFELGWNMDPNAKEYVVKAYAGWSTSSADFLGSKIVKVPVMGSKLAKSPTASFGKAWLKNRCERRDLFFGRQYTFTVTARNTLGSGPVSAAFLTEKPDLFPFLPVSLAHTNTGGNNYAVSWTSPGHDDRHSFKVWSSTTSGTYPPLGMTLRKTTGNTSANITISGTRPTYWRVQVLDDWDTDEAVFASDQKTIS